MDRRFVFAHNVHSILLAFVFANATLLVTMPSYKRSTKKARRIHLLHLSLNSKHGKASRCENSACERVSHHYDWALKKGHNYSDDPKDYFQLCRICHCRYDRPPATTKDPVYKYITPWRRKNPAYTRDWMKERRRHFKRMYDEGRIAYADIPKAYRYFHAKRAA
jgi:hypothetical protein